MSPGMRARHKFAKRLTYPAVARAKENGYLAIITVFDGMLAVYSKSGVTAYSRHAESILRAALTQEERARLTEALTRMDSSLTVEVVDPFRDPHIVPYEHVTLYLLDLIANTAQFRVKPARFEDLWLSPKAFAQPRPTEDYGSVRISTVEEIPLKDDADFTRLLQDARTSDAEGWVIRDSNGLYGQKSRRPGTPPRNEPARFPRWWTTCASHPNSAGAPRPTVRSWNATPNAWG